MEDKIIAELLLYIEQSQRDTRDIENELIPDIIDKTKKRPDTNFKFKFAEWTTVENTFRWGNELSVKLKLLQTNQKD